MSEKLGPVAFRRGEEHIFLGKEMTQQRDYSEHFAEIIDNQICSLIKGIEENITKILIEHMPQLKALASTLLEKETLESDAIQQIVESETQSKQKRSKPLETEPT